MFPKFIIYSYVHENNKFIIAAILYIALYRHLL